ncbi:APC family permease [Anaerotignum faecicola]|nr:APC family permease [Anaerotignum faecicola]
MSGNFEKKYGLFTAIAMVVGIVIGSGVFFKAEKVLNATGGNLPLGIIAWAVGALIMICCAYTFSVMATRYAHVSGVVDYAENTVGKKYAYYLGWFLATIYYPCLTSVLSWVSARYICVLFGFSITGGECMVIAGFLLVASYSLNALSPVLAGKLQVSTTIIKLVPLLLMAVIGTIKGISDGMTVYNFTTAVVEVEGKYALFTAVVATAFAYEGWIIATSINAEIKNAKKNLPIALVAGTFIIACVYISYYIGLAGTVENAVLMSEGEAGIKIAFESIFSSMGGVILFVFVIISCLGTLNGLMLASTRGIYAVAVRNEGPHPAKFSQMDKTTNMPNNSAVFGVLICAWWLLYFYGSNLTDTWFGFLTFDSSELPIITIYASYIPIVIMFVIKNKDLNAFNRFVMPLLTVAGCVFMVIAAIFAHRIAVVGYLIVFCIFMAAGVYFRNKNKQGNELND